MIDIPRDDRATFDAGNRANAAAMAANTDLTTRATDLVADADRYGYSYQWTWLGLPIIQMPPDIVAMQEIIWATRPQIVIETGIARRAPYFHASWVNLPDTTGDEELAHRLDTAYRIIRDALPRKIRAGLPDLPPR